jgi:integrase
MALKKSELYSARHELQGQPRCWGVSIEFVSKLLGHSSVKVTERHYAPWIKALQEQLR